MSVLLCVLFLLHIYFPATAGYLVALQNNLLSVIPECRFATIDPESGNITTVATYDYNFGVGNAFPATTNLISAYIWLGIDAKDESFIINTNPKTGEIQSTLFIPPNRCRFSHFVNSSVPES
jgi:hypothetical protein